jgi:hypothetical protein
MTTCTAAGTASKPDPGAPTGTGAGPGAPHRVLSFARAVDSAFDRLGDNPTWAMSQDEQRETLVLLDRVASRLKELDLRVLSAAEHNQIGADSGATSTAAWLANATRQTRPRCSAAVSLATELDGDFEATRLALGQGAVNPDQAHVIVKSVQELTDEHDELPDSIRERAEAHLLELAARFDAAALRKLGKRLYEVVCPEAADKAEGDRLAKEEERARRKALLTMHNNGDGTVEGRFRLPVLHAELLKKALEALTSPRRLGDGRMDPRTGKKLPYSTLLGHGFMELLEHHLNPANLPSQGGSPFTLVITMGIDALMSGVGVATLDGGARISAGEARRLMCRAGVIPAVLGGDSMVLDLGREQRLFDRHQRLALNLRYNGCAAANCDRPPTWTEAHHKDPWHRGGPTDLGNGIPLCPPHHHMADHPESWDLRTLPSGKVRFARRQ